MQCGACACLCYFFCNDTATTEIYTLSLHDALPISYKWLMGERGIGFLYVREDLQGTVLPTTRYGHRQVTNFNRATLTYEPLPGAARYETGGIPVILAAG